MFFLGHMSWAYVWSVIFSGKRWGKLVIPVVLMLGVLPDVDLFLWSFGVQHHTFTHSLFFWFIVSMPFLAVFRLRFIPYLVAIVQHFVFGDFLVGEVMLFWPFSSLYYGFDNSMVSVFNVGLETGGLLLAAGISFFNGDLKRLFSVNRINVLMVLPFLAVVTSMLFFAVDVPIIPLIGYIWTSPLLVTIVLSHLILVISFAFSSIQGMRKIV